MDVVTAPLLNEGFMAHLSSPGFRRSPAEGLLRIILGDTLTRGAYVGKDDFLCLGLVEGSIRFCPALTTRLLLSRRSVVVI